MYLLLAHREHAHGRDGVRGPGCHARSRSHGPGHGGVVARVHDPDHGCDARAHDHCRECVRRQQG